MGIGEYCVTSGGGAELVFRGTLLWEEIDLICPSMKCDIPTIGGSDDLCRGESSSQV